MRRTSVWFGALSLIGLSTALSTALAGCTVAASADGTTAGAGTNSMLDDVAVGQNRCPDEDGDARPFVVEWDATDLAAFEAKASRDLVFVKYEQCEIKMLYGCSDNGVPGRYGAYASPVFTSGTVESFEMRNQDELWAKLPLGAASIGAEVSSGSTLELEYFVSGTATSTRNYIERATIADNGRCAEATHYVSAYNLGAFRLLAHEAAAKQVAAGVAGAGRSRESANLKHGGEIDDCTSRTQQRCRVPIRLALQPIDDSVQDLDAGAGGAARPDPEPAEDTVSERAAKLRKAAFAKAQARDGGGCIDDLDRADALVDTDETRPDSITIRAYCTMLTNCDAGLELLREALALSDPEKKLGRYQLTAAETQAKISYCPVDQLSEDFQGTVLFERARKAQRANQPARCAEYGEAAVKLVTRRRKAGKKDPFSSVDAVYEVARCFSILRMCDESRHWYVEHAKLVARDKSKSGAQIEREAIDIWGKDMGPECEG